MRTLQYSFSHELKCKDHEIWGSLPCPWPNCPNSIPEEDFSVESPMEGESPSIYNRRKWQSLTGEPYYSWDKIGWPNWFNVPNTVWSEARRKGFIIGKLPELIYHYTTLEGLFGIVQSKNLWLSDYSYLNDTREISHGVDLITEVATELLKTEARPKVIDLLKKWIDDLKTPTHRVCIASFSANNDSLSQWRAYGSIALGFKPNDISTHSRQANLRPVEYNREQQRALVELQLHHMREAFIIDLNMNRLKNIENVYHKIDRLIELVSFFKDPSFESEQEYRLVFIEYPGLMESLGSKPSAKRFRISKNRIVPYVLSDELDSMLDNPPELKICEIMLGPESDDALERGVREFLTENGMGDVIIKRSRVPYRT